MKKKGSDPTPAEQAAELAALAAMPDDTIDTSDAPEVLDWSGAQRGRFYRPMKQQLTLRLDADVVAWFKAQTSGGDGYQTRINRALRNHVLARSKAGRATAVHEPPATYDPETTSCPGAPKKR